MLLRWLAPVLLCATCFAADQDDVLVRMDSRAAHFGDLSRRIWEFAEVGYKESRSAALLRDELRTAGFRIEDGVAGMPTAFVATWGSGKPFIGVMGEYDALPGLSQVAEPARKAVVDGAPGHGCGHNLLGTASAFAAISVKEWMEAKGIRGTIRFYGTPAEEGGGGKVYLIRAGFFQDADVVLSWHPFDTNVALKRSTLAIISAKFQFHGRPAHAAVAPDSGRSALDAAQLMTHAVDMMREHVPEKTRMHYIFTRAGAAPNIVPDLAEVFLYARHPEMQQLDGIWEWIRKCAEAGAMATQTRSELEIIDSTYNILPNDALSALVDRNLRRVGGLQYTPEETAFGEAIRKTLVNAPAAPITSAATVMTPDEGVETISTDAGDVSWVVPMSQLYVATFVPGTPLHTWQSAACAGMSIGRKGMVVAAKTLALSAMDLFTDPANVRAARESFDRRRAGLEYRSRIPAGHKPPLNYRDTK